MIKHRKNCRRPELPIDVIVDILLLLPAEHVVRCKLLSRTYYDLITKPDFINRHLLCQQSRNSKIAVMVWIPDLRRHEIKLLRPHYTGTSYSYKSPRGTMSANDIVVVGSCNGLLCLQLTTKSLNRFYTLWNPATGDYFQIPSPNRNENYRRIKLLGFGYGAMSRGGDYKLLNIGNYDFSAKFPAEVWSMSTNTWTEIGTVLPGLLFKSDQRFYKFDPAALCIRGSLYWLVHWRNYVSDQDSDTILVSFDMTTNMFGVVIMPADVLCHQKQCHDLTINNFMGSLALFVSIADSSEDLINYDVWVMDEDTGKDSSLSWTKKFSIGPMPRFVKPTGASIKGKFVMRDTGSSGYSEFYLYDPHRDIGLEIDYESSEPRYGVTPWCFSSSLISVKQTSQAIVCEQYKKRKAAKKNLHQRQ